jgi:hypothetical protein
MRIDLSYRPGPLVWLLIAGSLTACEAQFDVDLASSGYSEADELVLAIEGVDLLDEDGNEHELDASADDGVDVLPYADGDVLSLVSNGELAQGRYTGLRLSFADSGSALVMPDGGVYPIDIDNNLNFADIDIELDENDSASRIVVLEPRFSLHLSTTVSGHYSMTPVVRVIHPDRAGSISGTVDSALVRASVCQQGRSAAAGVAVYAFEGANVTPQDYVTGDDGSPVAAADVVVSSDGDSFHYDFPYLSAGRYTLAVTCNADAEDPRYDDGLIFWAATSVTLDEAESQTVSLSD